MATRIQKIWGALDATAAFRTGRILHVDQVTIIEILDADEVELKIGVRIDRIRKRP